MPHISRADHPIFWLSLFWDAAYGSNHISPNKVKFEWPIVAGLSAMTVTPSIANIVVIIVHIEDRRKSWIQLLRSNASKQERI